MEVRSYDIDISLENESDCQKAAISILKDIKAEWSEQEIRFKVFTAGITNKIFSTYTSPDDQLIFRVFGENTEKLIDRQHELDSWSKLAKRGLAAPLYAKFKNGLVCGYINGNDLNTDNVRDPVIKREICRSMAVMHGIETNDPVTPCSFPKMKDFLKNLASQFNDITKQEQFDSYFKASLSSEIEELEEMVKMTDEEVVFCHNDLLVHNILFDEKEAKVSFIDYEYADWNYTLFDIGNHFNEYSGVDQPDFTRCPNSSDKKEFLYNYLKMRHNHVDDDRLNVMCQRVPLFEAVSHLFWAIWALVQSQNSNIDFDYLGYAIARHEQYKSRLNKYNSKN